MVTIINNQTHFPGEINFGSRSTPFEIALEIFFRLQDPLSLASCCLVNRTWSVAASAESLWKGMPTYDPVRMASHDLDSKLTKEDFVHCREKILEMIQTSEKKDVSIYDFTIKRLDPKLSDPNALLAVLRYMLLNGDIFAFRFELPSSYRLILHADFLNEDTSFETKELLINAEMQMKNAHSAETGENERKMWHESIYRLKRDRYNLAIKRTQARCNAHFCTVDAQRQALTV